ncbi:MAG TPA: SMC-Scp complex subunit ScpB [Thermoanaerobaculia bacterium]|nr:SMC-Scp complex subunit ScpB [Thermoanaerobaculia bacterium]
MINPRELEAVLEAVLFVTAEPVPRSRLLEMFDEEDREAAALALETVLSRYKAEEGRGVVAEEVAGGVRLITPPELGSWLRRFFEVRSSGKLSMAALETLAIVAYRQPITGPEIQELRNVNPAGVLKTLLERRLIRVAGRKPVVGNPLLYRTTREFLVHFGLESLKELPPLEEFEELLGAMAESEGEPSEVAGPAASSAALPDPEEAVLREAAQLEEREALDPETEPV